MINYADAWIWYNPSDADELADRLVATMPDYLHRRVLIKAGGQTYTWEQYSEQRVQPFLARGIEPIAWVYYTPDERDDQVCLNTLRKYPSSELILNVEVEWGYSNQVSDDYVKQRIEGLRSKLRADGFDIPIGFSSVASWDWFPYAAFSESCDGTEQVQCYWKPSRADQVYPLSKKSRPGAKIVVGLPACLNEDAGGDNQEWTDQSLRDLAVYYATGTRDLVGFNGWQCGATDRNKPYRKDYAFDAMSYAYFLLPNFAAVPPDTNVPQTGPRGLPYNISDNPAVWHCVYPNGDVWVIQPEFISMYESLGTRGLEIFGLPISGMFINEQGATVQYFERARMELEGPGVTNLGLVGSEVLETHNMMVASSNGMLTALGVNG